LELNYIDSEGWLPAYVVLGNNRSLNIQYSVWGEADEGIPAARFIVAHELGHLILHNHHAQRFSGEKSKWISFEEESGEWQANKFAEHALVSDEDVCSFITPRAISVHCAVEYDVARRRLGKSFKYSGECCQECGSFTLVRSGAWFKCDTCGSMIGYS
jgi:predicted SprT family Zn-dependent metalloprotease